MRQTTRRQMLALTAGAMAWPVVGRAAPLAMLQGQAFGTGWRLALPPQADGAALARQIKAAFAQIDRQMSPWRGDSEVSRLNTGGAGGYAVSPATARVAGAALDLAQASDGAFDPSVGPLVGRWGFGPILSGQLGRAALAVEGDAIVKTAPGATLDLCGIAKGHALDVAAAIVRDAGVGSALFDLGGELAAIGLHPDGRMWQVGVEAPTGGLAATLALADGWSVATSGTHAQGYRAGERLFSHIIDPATGAPLDSGLTSVTVLARDAAQADGWATALLAAGQGRGPALARRHGISALFQGDTGQTLTGQMAQVLL